MTEKVLNERGYFVRNSLHLFFLMRYLIWNSYKFCFPNKTVYMYSFLGLNLDPPWVIKWNIRNFDALPEVFSLLPWKKKCCSPPPRQNFPNFYSPLIPGGGDTLWVSALVNGILLSFVSELHNFFKAIQIFENHSYLVSNSRASNRESWLPLSLVFINTSIFVYLNYYVRSVGHKGIFLWSPSVRRCVNPHSRYNYGSISNLSLFYLFFDISIANLCTSLILIKFIQILSENEYSYCFQ